MSTKDMQDRNFLLESIEVIVGSKRLIILTTLTAFFLSLALSYFLPKIYSSTTRLLPPQQDNGIMGLMMGQMAGGGMASIAGDLLGSGSPADMYGSILKSEAVKDAIIDRFKLIDVYKTVYRVETYKALDKKVAIEVGKKDGIISITVEDTSPQRAADIANAFVEELSTLAVRLNITGAKNNRSFIEERLTKAKTDLAKAEDALKSFQSKNKVLDIPEQTKGTIKGIADLEAMLAAEEVKLAGLKRVFSESSQEVKNQIASVVNIRRQIAKFEGIKSVSAVPGVGSVPELGQQYLRLMREFKIQESMTELLTKQYEMAKISEAKDASTIQVLQKARVPDKKIKPKKAIIVLMTTVMTFFFTIFISFVREYSKHISLEERKRWQKLSASLKPTNILRSTNA